MLNVDCKQETGWLPLVCESLRHDGAAVVTGVLDADFLAETRRRLYLVQRMIVEDVGEARLQRAGEYCGSC
jgi:hypothetical protein